MEKIACTLLIDDDEATNFINEMLLTDLDVTDQLLIARNGEEALGLIQYHCLSYGRCPDLILLDINMPVRDGFGFLKAFSDMQCINKESVVVVVLSTSANPSDTKITQMPNVVGYLNKPLKMEDVNQILNRHFR
jgi:response regulator of citrate/malate metabolism